MRISDWSSDVCSSDLMFRPLQELENLAPGTWYVNVLAVLPAFRNLGLGSGLLQRAEETARAGSLRGLSIIVSDSNGGARRLYERVGYREAATRPMVTEDWVNDGRNRSEEHTYELQ